MPSKDSLMACLPKVIEKTVAKELDQYNKQLDGDALVSQQLTTFRSAGGNLGSPSESIGQKNVQRSVRTLKNHFAGHTQKIQNVEEQIDKYKKKYKDAQSVKELAKDPPNPLHDKTFGERLWFGLNISPFKAERFVTDLSPFVGYRLNTHLSTGLALFYRVNFPDEKANTSNDMAYHAQGLRYFGEYQLGPGFLAHMEFEQAHIRVFDHLQDRYNHEWIPALSIGAGRKFKLSKRIKGHATVLYNFLYRRNPELMPQAINIRFGFRVD